jgi:aspartate/methionine/tyrosine aminotransferase
MQLLGVASDSNVAEGYPRFAPTPSQAAILARLGDLMEEALATPFPDLETRAHAAFFHSLGQASAPVGAGRIISFYASTIAIDVAAHALARRVRTVGLIHPVIDCVPALLRSVGLTLVPLSERLLAGGDPFVAHPEIEAVITANPNNPTGTIMTAAQLGRLADACARHGAPLVIDQCFRAFDPRVQYDAYEVLEATGVEYVIVEDTGKLWPSGGIKLGFLAWGARTRLDLHEIAADIILTVSPFSTLVVEQFADDMAAGGLAAIHERIATNRSILRETLEGSERATQADGASRVSVSRIRLSGGLTGTRLWGQLMRDGVHSVPCRPFYWADGRAGDRYLRIALAREPAVVRRAGERVRAIVDG